VTGARGFVGAALADRLRGDGWRVAGVDVQGDAEAGVVAGDISEPGAWQQAAGGCEVVFHTAAVVSNAVPLAQQWQVNVLGTRRAIDAAVAGGAGRFVLFSSVRAFGGDFPDGVDERWPVRTEGSAYVDTKVAAEQVALQAHAAGEIAVTIVRPGDVYGPGSRLWVLMPLELIKAGTLVLPDGGRGIFSPIYLDDLLDGVVLAATSAAGAGQVFTLTGGERVTNATYFGHLSRIAGKSTPRSAPRHALIAATGVMAAVGQLWGMPTQNNPETVRYLTRTGTYSIDKARDVLGFEPKVSLTEGMARTERWLRDNGFLDGS
jgi:nucleoside-diphosphate-sugar epimerase